MTPDNERFAAIQAQLELISSQLVAPEVAAARAQAAEPIATHIEDYLADCAHRGQAKRNIAQKRSHLRAFARRVATLADLRSSHLNADMGELIEAGKSARTANFRRQIVNAFVNWCVRENRCERNALQRVEPFDETRDRRRVRRPLEAEELERLFRVAEAAGRLAWYASAYYAGLRRGDLTRLRWVDIDFAEETITIRGGKAKRSDVLPIHPRLRKILHDEQPDQVTISTLVFEHPPHCRVQREDFERAGIPLEDARGRVVDLHALRTTLATDLARRGVAPELARRLLRHSSYRTTLDHYTRLGIGDAARAIARLDDAPEPTLFDRAERDPNFPGVSSASKADDTRPGRERDPPDDPDPPVPRDDPLEDGRRWGRGAGADEFGRPGSEAAYAGVAGAGLPVRTPGRGG